MGKGKKDDGASGDGEGGSPRALPAPGNGDVGDGRIERMQFVRDLPCRIEPDSVPARAAELARVITDRDTVREAKREANAKFREKLAFFDERMTELAMQVTAHVETRPVKCVEVLLTRTNEMQVVRLDTGEVVELRTATATELQEDLFPENDDDEDDEPPGGGRRGTVTEGTA
jgi:hypothetical protein